MPVPAGRALRQTCWDDLVLDEGRAHIPDDKLAAALAAAAAEDLERVFPKDDDLRKYLERVRWLASRCPTWVCRRSTSGSLSACCPRCARGAVRSTICAAPVAAMDQIAVHAAPVADGRAKPREAAGPERESRGHSIQGRQATRPGGANSGVVRPGRDAADRGWTRAGRAAPAGPQHRPQQVTDDLKSFWNNTYQQVRKDLRARYPKHSWPEDPWNAPPQRRPGKK